MVNMCKLYPAQGVNMCRQSPPEDKKNKNAFSVQSQPAENFKSCYMCYAVVLIAIGCAVLLIIS